MKKTEQARYAPLDEYKREGGTIKSFCERKGIGPIIEKKDVVGRTDTFICLFRSL